jgi:hypothetical protein
MKTTETAVQLADSNGNGVFREAENESEDVLLSRDTLTLIQRIRRRFFPTQQQKELIDQIHIGLDQGRRAAMLNIYRNNRVQ